MYNSIRPGQVWLDTNGKPIQAHGFSVFYKDGIWYWYGENKEKTDGKGTVRQASTQAASSFSNESTA